LAAGVVTFLAISAFGCGSPGEVKSEVPPTVENLRAVREGYFGAKAALDRPPRSKEELVRFLTKLGDPTPKLHSPDDGAEYVIVYGIDPLAMDSIAQVWAYERHGKDGMRWFIRGRSIQRMTNDNFAKLTFPTGHKPEF
jgi:hypothetical protein